MRFMLLATVFLLLASPAFAQIAISVNDNKVMLDNGTVKVVPNAPPDTLTVIDLRSTPPRVVKSDRLDFRPTGPDCSPQAWPYYETNCLRDRTRISGQARPVRVITTDRIAPQ